MSEPPAPPRRPYVRPRLRRHGGLVEITRVTNGVFGLNDMIKRRNKTGT